jgi:hypothetical protein
METGTILGRSDVAVNFSSSKCNHLENTLFCNIITIFEYALVVEIPKSDAAMLFL